MSKFGERLREEFYDKDEREYLGQIAKVTFIFVGAILGIIGMFWLLYKPEEWRHGGGGMAICDPVSGFQYHIDDKECVTIVDIIGINRIKKGCLKIPASFLGKPVTNIDLYTNNSRITSIEIPDSVTRIENVYLTGMQEIIGGDNVKTISFYAFDDCTSLEKVEFPKLEDLYEYAFSECTSLKEVKLGNYLGWVDNGAFYGCTSLENVELGYNVSKISFDAFNGCNNLKKVSITDNLLYIGDRAFASTGIEAMEIPNIAEIGEDAFQGTPWENTEEGKQIIKDYTIIDEE